MLKIVQILPALEHGRPVQRHVSSRRRSDRCDFPGAKGGNDMDLFRKGFACFFGVHCDPHAIIIIDGLDGNLSYVFIFCKAW